MPQQSTSTPTLACLGGGAVGFAVLTRLCYLQLPALVLTRTEAYHSVTSHGSSSSHAHLVQVQGFGSQWNFSPISRSSVDMKALRLIFITVQTYHLASALEQLAPELAAQTTIISLCNGYCDPILQKFQEKHPHLIVRLGVAFFNSTPTSFGYRCSQNAYILWGPLPPASPSQPQPVEQQLLKSEEKHGETAFFRYIKPISPHYQKKWIFNTTSNSLSAALGIAHAAKLVDDEEQLDRILEEAYRLSIQMWHQEPIEPLHLLSKQIKHILKLFGSSEISMHRHIRCGTRTENAYLAGCAEKYAPDFPQLRRLHRLITWREPS